MGTETASPTILVVDDDKGLLRLIEKALKREGFSVKAADSGKAAIEWLAQNRAELMLLDLKLPDFEGNQLVKSLEEVGRGLPFIIITGQGDERVAVEMMKQGALDYLVKDVEFLQFLPGVVQRAIEQVEREKRLAVVEAALRESEARFRLTADHAPVLIWMGGREKRCTWFNRPWLQFRGRTMEQELEHGWLEGVHPDDRERCLEQYAKAFENKGPVEMEYRLRRHDNEWRWILDSGVPLDSPTGEFNGYIGSCIDITERKRLEREVLEISEREQRRIGQDLHDGLGQHLTAVELMCQALKLDPKSGPDVLRGQLERVSKYIREAIALTRSLAQGLAAFKVQEGGLEMALTDLAELASSSGRVQCVFQCKSPAVIKDSEAAAHLYRIAQEAVNNAVRHSEATAVKIQLSSRQDALRLQITDNGKGFPKKVQQGMGLQVMKHRAGVIGGELQVKSEPGKGVTVTCTLPSNSEAGGRATGQIR
jgi:PAS domain S-box-containing protein